MTTPTPHLRRDLALASAVVLACALGILVMLAVPGSYFQLPRPVNATLHLLTELVSIIVCVLVFAIGWHTVARQPSSNVALLCCAFMGVAVLDLVHLLTFDGMPGLAGASGQGMAISFFLAARLVTASALLAAALQGWQRPSSPRARWGMLALSLGFACGVSALGLLAPDVRQLFFVPGQGLTPLKVRAEYLLVALHAAAAIGFALRVRQPQPFPVVHLLAASALMALAELCFALYRSPTDSFNLLGHAYKVLAYLYVYRAVFVEMVATPYRELEQAREALAASERRHRLLFETSMDGVLVLDANGTIEAANLAACALLGQIESQLVGRLSSDFVVADGRLELLRAERRATGRASGELTMQRADGSRFDALVSNVEFTEEDGRSLASVFIHDITRRKSAEAAVLALNEDLERRVSRRTAELQLANHELDRFAAAVAHDLRSPLGVIAGYARVLADKTTEPKAAHYVARIEDNARRMGEMIDSLLRLARLSREELRLQAVDLHAAAMEVLRHCRERDPGRLVQLEIQQPLRATADPRLVATVLENLIGNAWKFTAATTGARIEVRSEGQDEAGFTIFAVQDNGEGFDPAYAPNLFQMFHRLDTRVPGHGVGLATVRAVVERHGGQVWAEGKPGAGATFRFTLPSAQG